MDILPSHVTSIGGTDSLLELLNDSIKNHETIMSHLFNDTTNNLSDRSTISQVNTSKSLVNATNTSMNVSSERIVIEKNNELSSQEILNIEQNSSGRMYPNKEISDINEDITKKSKKKRHKHEVNEISSIEILNTDSISVANNKIHEVSGDENQLKHKIQPEIYEVQNTNSNKKIKKKKKRKHEDSEISSIETLNTDSFSVENNKIHKVSVAGNRLKHKIQPEVYEAQDTNSNKKTKKEKKRKHDDNEISSIEILSSDSFSVENNTIHEVSVEGNRLKHKIQLEIYEVQDTNSNKKTKKEKKRKHDDNEISSIEILSSDSFSVDNNKIQEVSVEGNQLKHIIESEIYEVQDTNSNKKTKKKKKRKHKAGEISSTEILNTEVEDTNNKKKTKKKKEMQNYSNLENSAKSEDIRENAEKTKKVLQKSQIDIDKGVIEDIDIINDAVDEAFDKNRLKDEDLNVLKQLTVLIPWKIPESHTIETRMSSAPTAEQRRKFEQLGLNMKVGPYSKQEDETIKTNWEKFCKAHNLEYDPTPFLTFMVDNRTTLNTTERIQFVRYLGKNLQHRMLHSIYRRFQTLFKTYTRGKFTSKEDQIILTYMESSKSANKYAELAMLLNRSRNAITRRHLNLTFQDQKFKWTKDLLEQLLENIMSVTGKEIVDELKHATITLHNWQQISAMMNISVIKLRRKWETYLYPKLFYREFTTLDEIRRKLIDKLLDLPQYDRRIINWNELAKEFDGITGVRLNKIFGDFFTVHVPDDIKNNFKESLNYLKQHLEYECKEQHVSKLHYTNGELITI